MLQAGESTSPTPQAFQKGVFQLHQQQSWKWNQLSDVYTEKHKQLGTKISGQVLFSPLHYLQVSSELGSWGYVNTRKGKIVLQSMWPNMQPDKYKVANLAIWQKIQHTPVETKN